MGFSLKKSLGSIAGAISPVMALPNLIGGLAGKVNVPQYNAGPDIAGINQLAQQEEQKRQALGQQQQGQINEFANQLQGNAANYRQTLAKSLSDTASNTFKQMNPGILEDLNSRGLFTSQTARDQEQSRVLGQLGTQQNQQLSAFDTDVFNQINDLRGQGLSSLLGGNQSALDSSLALRKAGLQRSFDVADTNSQNAFSGQLANQQSRNQLIASILGLGGRIGAASFGAAG